jgi:hypothetical protein
MVHQFAIENGEQTKIFIDKNASAHKFKISDKVRSANDFYTGKKQKCAPNYKGPAEIIDIKDTNAKVKVGNKIKVLNVEKLKLFLEENNGEMDTQFEDLNFNDAQFDRPITRTHAKLIKFKEAAQLALTLLKKRRKKKEISTPCVISHLTNVSSVMQKNNTLKTVQETKN